MASYSGGGPSLVTIRDSTLCDQECNHYPDLNRPFPARSKFVDFSQEIPLILSQAWHCTIAFTPAWSTDGVVLSLVPGCSIYRRNNFNQFWTINTKLHWNGLLNSSSAEQKWHRSMPAATDVHVECIREAVRQRRRRQRM